MAALGSNQKKGDVMRISRTALPAMLVLAGTFAAAQTIQVSKENRTIAVTATDSASALADQAVVHIGFNAYGTDEQSTYAEGSSRSNAILKSLAASGVSDDAVESENQNLSPLNEYELKNLPAALKDKRFRITQSWTVKTSPENAAKVLDTAVKAGANDSGNIEWRMKDSAELEAKAASKALAHAQSIAAQMAEGLHTKIGPLVYASNQQPEIVRPMAMRAMAAPMAKSDVQPLAIRSRKVEQSATVYAVFAVE